MTSGSFVPLAGSERTAISGVQDLGPVNEQERIEVTVVLRRRAELPDELVFSPEVISQSELADAYGAEPADVELVRETLSGLGLEITATDEASRRLKVAGTAAALTQVFGTNLRQARSTKPGVSGEVEHRYREGALQVPAALDGIVIAVLGLDNRPQVRAQIRTAAAAAKTTSYTPPQVAQAYQFPAGTDGTGETIAILEFGGGYSTSDLQTYFSGLGLSVPSVTAVGVDGGSNAPSPDPSGADGEVLLDIEVAGSVAPGAAQVVYFGPNTDQAFVDAISDAAHATPTPTVISISWGGPEETWSEQSRTALDQALSDAAALGVTVTVAAGDGGSSDGETDGKNHCDYPASSPYALACGGTRLEASTSTGAISSETVWNDGSSGGATGGGISDPVPVAVLAGQRGRARRLGQHGRPGRAGRGRQRGPADRLPGPGKRDPDGLRRNERGGPAVGGAHRPAGPVHGQGIRAASAAALRRGGGGQDRGWVQRHHQRQQRGLFGRAGLGSLHGPGVSVRHRPADPAERLTVPPGGPGPHGRAGAIVRYGRG